MIQPIAFFFSSYFKRVEYTCPRSSPVRKGHIPWGAAGGRSGPHSRSNIVPHCSMHTSRQRVLSTGTSPSFTECPKLGYYAHLSTCWKPGSLCMSKRVSYACKFTKPKTEYVLLYFYIKGHQISGSSPFYTLFFSTWN